MTDLFNNAPNTRDKIAPEPEIFLRAQDAEKDLDKVSSDLAWAETDLKKAADKREQIQAQIADAESRAGGIRDDITADTLDKFAKGQSNKEQRDASVAKALRDDPNYTAQNNHLLQLKTDLRNAVTEYDLATGRVKTLHRRVDAAVSKARLISSQIQTLGHLIQFDTAKLQLGALRK